MQRHWLFRTRRVLKKTIPVSIPLEEKKKETNSNDHIKTYIKPSRHEFISSKQLNTPLLAPYEFVIAGTPVAMFVVGVAILVQPREKRLKSSLNRTRIIMNDSFRQLQIKKKLNIYENV